MNNADRTALAHTISAALLCGERHTTPLGCWSLSRRCVLISHPRAAAPGEPDRDLFGRPRLGSGHWLVPLFRPSRALRQALRSHDSGTWSVEDAAIITALKAGERVRLPGLGELDRVRSRGVLRPRFRFAEPFRRRIGAAQRRLLCLDASPSA
ncbi:MAG: hypothetical protein P8R54_28835 [Myxococcota bacterium]|nr:hypothetical protein [Myxococcota bacterium]